MSAALVLTNGVLLDRATLDAGDLDLTALERACPRWSYHDFSTPEQVPERLADAQVVIANKVVLDHAALKSAAHLRLVAIAATGTNNVDLDAARGLGIRVTNVPAYATPSVVQHVFACLLGCATRLADQRQAVRAGRWSASRGFCLLDPAVREIAGLRLGIVGYGTLGQAVARMAEAFGMEVLIAARPGASPPYPPERLPLAELLPLVDALTLHCPLASNTRNLIGAAELALMKPSAWLINTARGGIVDEAALAAALRQGTLAGAAVDVLSVEPPPATHALLAPDIPNLILTPHVAWASRAARQRLVDTLAVNIEAFSAGAPRHVVA